MSGAMNGRCCSMLKNVNVYITDTTINSIIILWERNALKQHTRDLGVIITETLDVTKQCVRAANKANAMLGMINRAFKYKTKEVVLKLYKSLVRPHLDYCIQAWRPFKQKDIDLLESIQRRMSRIIPELRLSRSTKNTKNNNFGNKKGESRFIGSFKSNKWVG